MSVLEHDSAHTRRLRVWQLLSDGWWHTTMEINAVNVGGSEGCRRLRELRALCREMGGQGSPTIERRRCAANTTQWEYRVTLNTNAQPVFKKQPSKATIKSAILEGRACHGYWRQYGGSQLRSLEEVLTWLETKV